MLVRDMLSRYKFDSFLLNTEPTVAAEMYEKWTRLISEELHKQEIIDKIYKPVVVKNMSFWDAVMVRKILS